MAQTSNIDSIDQNNPENSDITQLNADSAGKINLPDGHFVGDSELSRDGQDLTLEFSNGDSFAVEGYFSQGNDFLIEDSAGGVLTTGLADSFIQDSPEYAQNASMSDESPVGAIEELKGEATVTRADGSSEDVTLGTPIYQGDIIQTSGDGAVNVVFMDETSMAISDNARIAIDNYKFDAATESGETDFSVLRGVFVYTSGLIGRDDPDDVEINTPVGSIGIRGTIIAGNINPEGESEISVLEGAIVIRNGAGERTLSEQYETVKLSGFQDAIEYKGVEAANDIGETYGSVSDVLPKLFSSINDAAKEEAQKQNEKLEAEQEEALEEQIEEAVEEENIEAQDAPADPALELIEEGLVFGEPQELGAEQNLSPEGRKIQDGANEPKPALHNNGGTDEILFQEAKDFTEDPQITHHFKPVFEHSKTGDVVGIVTIKNYPAGTTIEFSGTPTNYVINPIAGTDRFEIKLTVSGSAASNGAVGTPLEALTLVARLPNGDEISIPAHTPTVVDSFVNLNTNHPRVTAGTPIDSDVVIGDFDGDTDNDYARIVSGDVNISNVDDSSGDMASPGGGNYTSIADVGDVDNDGVTDLVFGDPTAAGGRGSATLIDNLATATTSSGANTGDNYGTSVAGIGDFDGDGKSDYIVGGASAATVHYGGGGGTHTFSDGVTPNATYVDGVGDIDGDGLSDLLVSSTTYARIYQGDVSAPASMVSIDISGSGSTIVAAGAAGDINGDGFDDFALSLNDGTDINTYVIYGHDTFSGTLSLSDLENPDNALKIHHAGASGSNYQITALGDIDGNGFDSIQVGVSGGEQFVVHGDIGGTAQYATDGSTNDTAGTVGEADGIISTNTDGQSLVGDVDFNDNGQTGLRMTGGNSDNTFEINNDSFSRIDGGAGFDTIKFMPVNGVLNFTNIDFEQIQQVEAIEFGNTGQQITLTAENIFNMLKSSDTNELWIKGNGSLSGFSGDIGATLATYNGDSSSVAVNTNETHSDHSSTNTFTNYQIGQYNLYVEDTAINVV